MRCCCRMPHDRDLSILKHIVSYCEQIDMAMDRFGRRYEIFAEDPVYRTAVSLCILQIGELVGHLSEEFRAAHTAIPWRQIKLMRNIVAHRYQTVDHTITWDVLETDIPVLRAYCEKLLENPPRTP